MRIYENPHFGLRIRFPDNWNLVSWKYTKINRSYRSDYQSRDDELPAKGSCCSKFLFTACLNSAGSEAMVDADIEVAVFRVAPGEDMRESLLENFERERESCAANGLTKSITNQGTWTINDVDFGFVDEDSKSSRKRSQYRFFFRRIDDKFWLYGKIAGHTEAAFREAINLVEEMTYRGRDSSETSLPLAQTPAAPDEMCFAARCDAMYAAAAEAQLSLGIYKLSCASDDDYPTIKWNRHGSMSELWLEIDDRLKAGQPIVDLLEQIEYQLRLTRRWPRVDCVSMMPGLAISARAKVAFEALGVTGMKFLEFRIDGEPYFRFYTDRKIDCLDRQRSEIRFFASSPDCVKEIKKYAFVKERLQPCDVFAVPELSDGMFFWSQHTFFTQRAISLIEESGLIGFRFQHLPS